MTPLFIGGLGMSEVLVIALVVLLFFGGKKIPELMKGLGKGVRSFKEGMNNVEKRLTKSRTLNERNNRMANETNTQSFWEHLDVLRTAIVKIVAVAVVFGIVAFFSRKNYSLSYLHRRKTVLLHISYLTTWRHGREVR